LQRGRTRRGPKPGGFPSRPSSDHHLKSLDSPEEKSNFLASYSRGARLANDSGSPTGKPKEHQSLTRLARSAETELIPAEGDTPLQNNREMTGIILFTITTDSNTMTYDELLFPKSIFFQRRS
jgi:hypothetical protein